MVVRRYRVAGLLGAVFFISVLFAGLTNAGTPSDPQVLDAHEQEVENPGLNAAVEEIVPLDALVARCGDGDGCRLRLFMGPADNGIGYLLAAKLFTVESTGAMWTTHTDAVVLGGIGASGDSQDAAKGSIMFLNTGSEICEFYESGTTNDYRLNSIATSLSDPFDCRLRIDD